MAARSGSNTVSTNRRRSKGSPGTAPSPCTATRASASAQAAASPGGSSRPRVHRADDRDREPRRGLRRGRREPRAGLGQPVEPLDRHAAADEQQDASARARDERAQPGARARRRLRVRRRVERERLDHEPARRRGTEAAGEVVALSGRERDDGAGEPGEPTLERAPGRGAAAGHRLVEAVPVERVHDARARPRQPRGHAAERAGLRGVRVHDGRAEAPEQRREADERAHVRERRGIAGEVRDLDQRHAAGGGARFVGPRAARDQHRPARPGGEPLDHGEDRARRPAEDQPRQHVDDRAVLSHASPASRSPPPRPAAAAAAAPLRCRLVQTPDTRS